MRLTKVLSIVIGGVVVLMIITPILFWLLGLSPPLRGKVGLDGKEWLALYAVFTAVLGWLFAAWVQVRNSIKQHTINTMLQSRLSSSFQEKAAQIRAVFQRDLKFGSVLAEDLAVTEKQEALESLRYMLNYYEFIAVGIRKGDFDEELMRLSWRGIVVSLVSQTTVLIDKLRGKVESGEPSNPRGYENLLWLYERWNTPA
jgi:hypothetical protein